MADQRGKGYFPRLVGAHRLAETPSTETFAVMVEQGAPEARLSFALGMELPAKVIPFDPSQQHEFLRSCALYGRTVTPYGAQLRYVLVWEAQPQVGKVRWNAFTGRDGADVNSKGHSWPEQLGALTKGFWRPDLVSVSEPGQGYGDQPSQILQFGNRFYSIWRDDALNAWSVHDLHDEAQLGQLLGNIEPYRMPIRLQLAGPPGPGQRIVAMLAVSDEVIERVTTIDRLKETTPQPAAPTQAPTSPAMPPSAKPFAACDAYVLDLIKRESIRCAQLAIAYNGRLVHAAALTHAEPGYLPVTNEHVMRVGSISKALTGIAIGHAWGKGDINPCTEPVGNILAKRFPVGDPSLHSRPLVAFLAHCSGLISQNAALTPMANPCPIADDAQTADITDEDWVRYFLTKHPQATNLVPGPAPGGLTCNAPPPLPRPAGEYNGAGFMLAGQCLAIAMKPDAKKPESLEDAMLDPKWDGLFPTLQMKRPRVSQNKVATALKDQTIEVLYHGTPHYVEDYTSLQLGQYGYEFTSLGPAQYAAIQSKPGAAMGTWALAAVDVARIFSLWDVSPHPLFDGNPHAEAMARAMLQRYSAGCGMGIFVRYEPTHPEWGPMIMGHNGSLLGALAVVARRRFHEHASAPDPPDTSLVVAMSFNGDSHDADIGDIFGGCPIDVLQLAFDYGSVHGWPSWNLFDEVGLLTYGL